MPVAQNLVVLCEYSDGAYRCTVDVWNDWTQSWENSIYVARRGDPAPVNVWIIEQIDTGAYNPISICPLPPTISASFSPTAIVIGSGAILSWNCTNTDSVTLSDDPTIYPLSGSKEYTPSSIGPFSVTITANSIIGSVNSKKTVNVVATQTDLDNFTNGPTVI